MPAHTFASPLTAADLWFVAPLFDPGVADGGVAATAGRSPADEEHVLTALDLAEKCVDREFWGEKSDTAVCLLAAHGLFEDAVANATDPAASTSSSTAVAGAITSESVGPLSRSFGAVAGAGFQQGGDAAFANEVLATTPFGKRLVQLRRTLFAGGVF